MKSNSTSCSRRAKLNARLQDILDRQTDRWGIKVSLVEIKALICRKCDGRCRARPRPNAKRAKIIRAEGEYQAAEKLVKAANAIATEPVAIQLRYLQTLTEIGIGAEHGRLPDPLQMMEGLSSLLGREKFELPVSRPAEPVTVSPE